MIKIFLRIIALKSIILILLIFSAANFVFVYLNTAGPLTHNIELIVEPGLDKKHIIKKLYKHDVIKFPQVFYILTKFYGFKYQIKSGEYLFTSNITPLQVLEILTIGKSIVRKLVIPEGYTVQQIIDKLYRETRLIGEIHEIINEGHLLPNTYFYSYNDQRQMLINQMKKKLSATLDQFMPYLSPDSPLKTRADVLKLASIVERETSLDVEKPRVAQVYLNRLNKNMKLQADPTTIYAITLGKYNLSRPLLRSDLFTISPYNTYMVFGLPPTPIACPGIKAIEAVIRPTQSDELFFVANGKGGHNFSVTAEQHFNYVNQYRQQRKTLNSLSN